MTGTTTDWKSPVARVLHNPSTAMDVGQRLASALSNRSDSSDDSSPSSLEAIAIHILNLAIDTPAKIDVLLTLYTSLATSLPDDFEEGGWRGKAAARKAIGIQLSEVTQSLNPVLKPVFVDIFDDTCQNLPEDAEALDVASSVRQMAAHRRTYVVAAAMYARTRTVDVVMEDDPRSDMGIERINDSLGLVEGAVVQAEANHIAAGAITRH